MVAGISGGLGKTGAVETSLRVDEGVGESFDFLVLGSEAVADSGGPRFLVLGEDVLEPLLEDADPSKGSAIEVPVVSSVIAETACAAWFAESSLDMACC
jgi:hypothetical protein